MNELVTGVTLRKRNDNSEFSYDFDQPGDYYASVSIVYRMLERAQPDEDLEKWAIAETRGVLA